MFVSQKGRKRRSIGSRVAKAVVIITLGSSLTIGLFSYYIYRKDAMSEHAIGARDIATSVASAIEPEEFLASVASEEPDGYRLWIKSYLDRVKTQTDVAYLYILAPLDDSSISWYAEGMKPADDPEDISYFGEIETDLEVLGEEVFTTLDTAEATITSAYDSKGYGMMVSGFAPILDADGRAIGAVGVDIEVDDVVAAANTFGMNIAVVGVIFSIIFAFISRSYIKKLISFALRRIIEGTRLLGEGDLTFEARQNDTSDEVGILYANFAQVMQTFRMLINDMSNMSKMHAEGEFDVRMDESKYTGIYLDVVHGVNSMTFMYVDNFMELLDVVKSYGNGNFEANIKQYPGKLSQGNVIVDELRNNLARVNDEIISLAETALNGDLSARVDSAGFSGGWLKIMLNLNSLIEAIVVPITEASSVLNEMAQGNLDVSMKGDYRGDFSLIKDNMNKTIEELSFYIKEIREILEAVSRNDLSLHLKRHFLGDFVAIEKAIQSIIEAQDKFFRDIGVVAEQLNNSSASISASGSRISKGADEQSQTIQTLTLSVSTINSQTQDNAKNAEEAEKVSAESMKNATDGNEEMKNMLASMDEIKSASNNIAKIMKVIDDIAFQTNLLALNAAVEAARAGEHGKGFAVVAEEVRNLASRSLIAAKQTQELIDDTITRVNEGAETAKSTSDALLKIFDNVSSVSEYTAKISAASKEQAEAVALVTDGLSQIAGVVQDSASTANENADASAELAEQAGLLNKLLSSVKFI